MKTVDLINLAHMKTEGIFQIGLISEGIKAPKGELAEIARGSDHRAVAMRFKNLAGHDALFYYVVPLLDFSGEQLTDNKVRSGIQNRMKDIVTGMEDGKDMSDVLQTIFMNPRDAITHLKSINRTVSLGSENERQQLAQQAPDPIRDRVAQALRLVPDSSKTMEMLLKLRPGMAQRLLDTHAWDQDTRAEFIVRAAELIGNDVDNPKSVKLIAELALAYMAVSVLEKTKS